MNHPVYLVGMHSTSQILHPFVSLGRRPTWEAFASCWSSYLQLQITVIKSADKCTKGARKECNADQGDGGHEQRSTALNQWSVSQKWRRITFEERIKLSNSLIRQNALKSNVLAGSHAISEKRDTSRGLLQIFFSYPKFILKRPSVHSRTIQVTTKVLVHVLSAEGWIHQIVAILLHAVFQYKNGSNLKTNHFVFIYAFKLYFK